jgi:hypothetical protein
MDTLLISMPRHLFDITDSLGDNPYPKGLAAKFESHPPPEFDADPYFEATAQMKSLYLADFEMARLKEMRDSKLMMCYLKAEAKLPEILSGFAGLGVKFIVRTLNVN